MRIIASSILFTLLLSSTGYVQDRERGRQGKETGPEVGTEAPNFKATVLGKKKEVVELKKVLQKTKKPVVLIFGSYT